MLKYVSKKVCQSPNTYELKYKKQLAAETMVNKKCIDCQWDHKSNIKHPFIFIFYQES